MGILEDEPAAGIRWQIGSPRKASAATWRREHLVRRGSVETGDADDGAAATWRREHLVRRGGGGQAMQRTARRLIRSGAVMAEVRERCSGGGRRCGSGALIEGGGGRIDLDRSDFRRMI
ncbi:hypothetical protein OsJ_24906 [Oryza sativa Japonica Group]|nr:hypothetical protein OsJ_24906 [Oryza sativa Japonica Group]